jgi:elongation factor Ts
MAISAQAVKELRETTGAGMMDCKNALNETNGNIDEAIDWLRTKGLAKAAKKSGRVASEGLVGVASTGTEGALVEVNSETDFVARNDQFQSLAQAIANAALQSNGTVESLSETTLSTTGKNVSDSIKDAIATIGENIALRRTAKLSVQDGVVASYIHNKVTETLGKIGVLVALESSGDKAKLETLGRQIAMHVAAASPLALNVDELDADIVERERAVFAEQAKASGKPDNIIEKMVEGRIRKFYEESVLLKQAFVMNPDKSIEAAIKDAEADIGASVTMTGYLCFRLGEGIEKEEGDFAAEVLAAAKG